MIEKQCKSYEFNIFPHKDAIRCVFRRWKLNFCNFLTDNIFRCPDLIEEKTFKWNVLHMEEHGAIPRVTRVTWGI